MRKIHQDVVYLACSELASLECRPYPSSPLHERQVLGSLKPRICRNQEMIRVAIIGDIAPLMGFCAPAVAEV